MKTLSIRAGVGEYTVIIGSGALSHLPDVIRALNPTSAHIVADLNTARYVPKVVASIASAGVGAESTIIPAGEESKTPTTVARLCSRFASSGLDRRGLIIALGGGVVGDIAGFAAATYMRGVPYLQLPTTLVALIDSSIGGKTAVDLPEGKNLMGAFHQPSAVIADLKLLASLNKRELRAGLGEVAKYYALGAVEIADLLPINNNLEELAYVCCELKARLVEVDEFDTGARQALNLGHTFGHAIEKFYDFKRYSHGDAVAIGLRLALETGVKLGVTPPDVAADVLEVMARAELRTTLDIEPSELVPHMQSDKKAAAGRLRLVLIEGLGKPLLYDIDAASLTTLIKSL
ncbi:MAG: 3-dehydroquinate synthase [Oscillospiraceae bacterium]|jgi:3-dehydroquinate synthase|nr:3-dehydroquinate synthase [Oscillospiraceae bacterium]